MEEHQYRVAGYVKLAKLWERSASQAFAYHRLYYNQKYCNSNGMKLADVYIDITGQKQIYNRPEMLRLLRDCKLGKVDCIATQTKGYLAANSRDFCFLLMLLSEMASPIEIVTEDAAYRINTIMNIDGQRAALYKMAKDYVELDCAAYESWKNKVEAEISNLQTDK